jgi:hypothetical protein
MDSSGRILVVWIAAVSLAVTMASAQDSQSLGDLARRQRQQKDQSKTAPEKNLKPVKVITNEEIPEHPEITPAYESPVHYVPSAISSENAGRVPAAQWKSQILAQKNQISSLERQVNQINESIRFAPANCVANCVGWNERQREKQQQVERMQAQLQDQKKQLEEMQDSARKQGYGSSVYDP